ncbi:UNVERIFIED_CONTAM: hypothetical protein K2H54_046945 [Gekko kuhli]
MIRHTTLEDITDNDSVLACSELLQNKYSSPPQEKWHYLQDRNLLTGKVKADTCATLEIPPDMLLFQNILKLPHPLPVYSKSAADKNLQGEEKTEMLKVTILIKCSI